MIRTGLRAERRRASRRADPDRQYVYIHRGLLNYFNSEAELASVLGHEIGHDVARHPARAETRDVLMSVGAVAAAIRTHSYVIGDEPFQSSSE